MIKILSFLFLCINSVQVQASLGQLRQVTNLNSIYTVHETVSNHTRIREYVSNGVVFAVAWNGVVRPDLNKLLAEYFEDYKNSAENTPRVRGMRGHGLVQGQKVVVEHAGHMRSLQGKAYVPALMPAGVTPNEIQ